MTKLETKGLVHQLATELMEAVSTGDQIDGDLLETTENFIKAHQLIVQLLYVSMVVERITQLPHYFNALDAIVEDVDVHDLAEADAATKLRAISSINAAIKAAVDIINNMVASKDATGLLVANLKDMFGGSIDIFDEGEGQELMTKIQNMKPEKRQRLLGGIVGLLRTVAEDEDDDK